MSLQSFQVKSQVFVWREQRVEALLLDEVVCETPQPVAGMRRERDFLLAEVEEDVGGGHAEEHALDVEQARVARLVKMKSSFQRQDFDHQAN